MNPRLREIVSIVFLAFVPALAGNDVLDSIHRFGKDVVAFSDQLHQVRVEMSKERLSWSREMTAIEQETALRRRELEELRTKHEQLRKELSAETSKGDELVRDRDAIRAALNDFRSYFQTTVHILELPEFTNICVRAHAAYAKPKAAREMYLRHLDVLDAAVERSATLTGPRQFGGRILVGKDSEVSGQFLNVGPITLFAATNGNACGLANPHGGKLGLQLARPETEHFESIRSTVRDGAGQLPLDLTGKYALTRRLYAETLPEHIRKGGPVMIAILGLGLLAFSIGAVKGVQVCRVKINLTASVDAVLQGLSANDPAKARRSAEAVRGWSGVLLRTAVENFRCDPVSLRLALNEAIAAADWTLRRSVIVIAVAASTAPLLGLLGTVTGMISTFRLISVHGTGDPSMLSAGISESLITTEYGLIVAFPSIVIHTLVKSRIRRVIFNLESVAQRLMLGLAPAGG